MVMRLVGEEAALCLKNLDGDRLLGASQTDGAGGFADLNPKVPHRRIYQISIQAMNMIVRVSYDMSLRADTFLVNMSGMVYLV